MPVSVRQWLHLCVRLCTQAQRDEIRVSQEENTSGASSSLVLLLVLLIIIVIISLPVPWCIGDAKF